jgi:beta-lactamase regulating signal transducer with metallopeptidase domain
MSELFSELSWVVLRSTAFLSIAAVLAFCSLKLLRLRSAGTVILVWSVVLCIGILPSPTTFEIPWYDSIAREPATGVISDAASAPPYTTHRRHAGPATPTAAVVAPQKTVAAGVSLRTVMQYVWFAGVLAVSFLAVAGYAALVLALKSAWKPQRAWQGEYDQAALALNVSSPPSMLVHPHLGPFLCLTPRGHRLVVPSRQWSGLSVAERHVVLKHELAHYIRRDVWRWLPMRLIVLLHWFNPLGWLAVSRIEEAAERSADQIALRGAPAAAGDLANALLKLAQANTGSRVLASAARGRSLTRRLRHLIHDSEETGAEPMLKRVTVLTVLACVFIAGAVQLRLVAQEADDEQNESREARVTQRSARQFSEKLVGDDELTVQLRAALQDKPGALVLRDRAGHYEQQAREELQGTLIPSLVGKWFDETPDGLTLKDGKESFREDFLQSAEGINEDISGMLGVMKDVASEMDMDTDLDKLVHRFLTDDAAPIILYQQELRQRMRPGIQVVERLLQDVFAERRDGSYEIRPDGRGHAEHFASGFGEKQKMLDLLVRDLSEFADEIVELDDFHIEAREALKDPLFVTRLGLDLFEHPHPNRAFVEHMVQRMEEAFRDTGDGLVVRNEDFRREIQEHLEQRERFSGVQDMLRTTFRQFADNISGDDELHEAWKHVLTSDMALVRFGSEMEYGEQDIEGTVRQFLGQILSEKDNGRLHVQPAEIPTEEIEEIMSHMFRQSRSARRRGRELDELVENLQDDVFREALLTPGGRLAFADHLRQRMMGSVPDGLEDWIGDHFEETGDGYVIRDEAREAIQEFVSQVADVTREIRDADF